MGIRVLIDGVEVEVKNDIRVVYDVKGLGEGKETGLQVTANHEGLVYDLFQKRENTDEEITGTGYDFVTDLVERCNG